MLETASSRREEKLRCATPRTQSQHLHLSRWRCPVSLPTARADDNNTAVHAPGDVSGWFGMVNNSSTTLKQVAGTGGPQEVPDSHDRKVARVSRQMRSSGQLPREIRHRAEAVVTSVFNVPLMWAAASGGRKHAIDVGGWSRKFWTCNICGLFRKCCAVHERHLAEWIHNQGFRRPRCGAHFSGKAQERILNGLVAMDARGAGLEVA